MVFGKERVETFDPLRGGWQPSSSRSPLFERAAPPLSWLVSVGVGLVAVALLWAARERLSRRLRADGGAAATPTSTAHALLPRDAGLVAATLLVSAPLVAAAMAGLVF